MSVLADTISPGSRDVSLHFLAERRTASLGHIWDSSPVVAGWLAARGTAPAAMVLSNTLSCAKAVVGAVAAGAHVVSIPAPPPGADLAKYARFVAASCALTGATTLVVDASYLAKLPPLPEVTYSSYDEMLRARVKGGLRPERFVLTQFTSGNTGEPRGVALGQAKIKANVEAVVAQLALSPEDGVCSWFPLSHEMGLLGMFFPALAGSGSARGSGPSLVLLSPEMFRRRPASWLEACAELGSTVTGSAPSAGFEMAVAARRRASTRLDLSRVRVCITGSEPIRPATLAGFARAFEATGWAPEAISPAYGLTECALVALAPPGEEWQALSLDPVALASGRIVHDRHGCPIVSAGRPLPGYDVRVEAEGEIGEIVVGGPSIAERYATGGPVARADGRLATGDLGCVVDGSLYVVGRRDDVFPVAGRPVYAADVEDQLGNLPGIRLGRVVAVPGEAGAVWIAAEHDGDAADAPGGLAALVSTVRDCVRRCVGAVPQRVAIVPRGELPLSLTGKVQRFQVRASMLEDRLPTVRTG